MKKLKPGEWVVLSRFGRYPYPTDESASIKRWRSFSPTFWGIFQGLWQGLLQPRLWEAFDDDLRYQIIEHFFDETPCLPEPQPEPQPEPTPQEEGSGVSAGVGITGLSYEELEDFFMSWSLRGQLAWVNGQLCYWSEGCCDWQPVQILSGLAATGLQKPQTGWTIEGWVDAGKPPVEPIVPVQLPPPDGHISRDAIICAKVSGIFAALHELLVDLREALQNLVPAGTVTLDALVLALTAAGLTAGTAVLLVVAFGIFEVIASVSASTLIDEIDVFLDDWETYLPGWVCHAVDLGVHDEGTTVTMNDIQMVLLTFYGSTEAPAVTNHWQQIINKVPTILWADEAQELATKTPCACEDYLPSSYTPPPVSNVISFVKLLGLGGAANTFAMPTGEPQDQIDLYNPLGSKTGTTAFRSQYRGTVSPNYYSSLGMLFHCEEELTINEVAANVDVNNINAGDIKLGASVYTATGWGAAGGGVVIQNPSQDGLLRVTGLSQVGNYIAVFLQLRNNPNSDAYLTIPNVLFTGQIGGVGFLDKGIGESLL